MAWLQEGKMRVKSNKHVHGTEGRQRWQQGC